MSGDLTARDDLVQQLAEVIGRRHDWNPMRLRCACGWRPRNGEGHADHVARAVLASGLVVPTSHVLNLAVEFGNAGGTTDGINCAAELRALTQSENR